MNRKHILYVFLFLCGVFSYGQKVTKAQPIKSALVSGKVVDKANDFPVFGATIMVKGSANGVAADLDGNFEIQVNKGDLLLVSSIGYENAEYKVTDINKKIVVLLQENIEALQAITVVGYGKQERRDLTGAIGSIKGEKLDNITASFDNALAGKISGVQVNSSSGVPGSATSITIRGITSLNANSNNPLIVIDGVPVYGTDRNNNTTDFSRTSVIPGMLGGGSVSNNLDPRSDFERNPLSMLNMDDIESIEILKDAYATAIYGSRGAAGVILITTKSGAVGKPRINVNYSTTLSNPVATPDVLNAQQYSDFYNKYYDEQDNPFPVGIETNWLDRVTRTAVANNLSASMAAGTEKMKYYFSFSVLDQESYIVGQDYKKYSARVNTDYKFSDKLKFGTNVTVNFSDNNALNAQSIYRNAVLKAPNVAEKTALGDYYFGSAPNYRGSADNPLAQAYRDINYVKDSRTIGNAYLEYEPVDGLTLKSEVGIDYFGSEAYSRLISRPDLEGGSARETTKQNRKLVVNNTINYVKNFNKHAINSVIGQSFEKSREQATSIFGRNFDNDNVLAIGRAGNRGISNTLIQEWALFSAFGRLNYQYDNKYLAGVTYRVDGSSRFNKNNRYIGFPSFSLGWRLSEEAFMKGFNWIDDLKFRGSMGFTGIDGTSGYYGNQGQYLPHPNGLNYNGVSILQARQPNNPNLKWERTRTLDLGVDANLFGNRVDLQVDYYHKKITNMLYSSAVPWYMGYPDQQQNIGDMENRGIEVTLNTINISTPDFRWTTDFNIARNTNKILKLNYSGSSASGAELGYKYFAEGESAAQFFLYDWAGVNPLTGNPLWNYVDGTQSETPPASLNDNPNQHRSPMGDAMPDFFGGITNTFSYKNIELSAFFSFAYGGQLYNGAKAQLFTYSQNSANNLSTDILDYWLIPGHRTDIPQIHNASLDENGFGGVRDYTVGRDSDRFLEDASYIRLKNIRLAYNFPKTLLDKYFLSKLTLYIQGNNLLTFTKYTGQDPEVNAFGSSALLSGYAS
ncbi:TonB-dependent receptor [Zhouia spongiae]|uniref:TonB-dependent receptor n=1 Tax=Zhouia spongiae TaxID=2202721 RepID=A0ABY3YMD1_9FLAO|nr:TonB-dependent receptor [Zhouia spongiae]UNY98754.1 TonB-dependent receptor [Zhouia spongiae]